MTKLTEQVLAEAGYVHYRFLILQNRVMRAGTISATGSGRIIWDWGLARRL